MGYKDKIESGFAGYPFSRNHGLVRCFRYSWEQHVLEIGFQNGTLFWYYDFPESKYSSLSGSNNPDSFFKNYIENKFRSDEYLEDDFSDELLLHSTICLNKLLPYFHIGQYSKVVSLCDRIIQKKIEQGLTNSALSMENMEKAKAFCKLGRYAEVIPLLTKQTGIYASHLKIYAYMKMDRLDQALKLLKKLVKSRGKEGLYIGRIEFLEVHQLFVEMAMMSFLKRSLTNDEKQVILDVLTKKNSSYDPSFVSTVSQECEKLTLFLDVEQLEKIYLSFSKSNVSKYLSFDDARQFAQNLNLNDEQDWKKYSISGQKPDNIPLNPKKEYALEWKNWNDWLGTTKRKYLSYDEAKKFISEQFFESEKDWKLFCKSGKLPVTIPMNPKNVYTSIWTDWDDWLGVFDREYLSFEQSREFVGKLLLEYHFEWKDYCQSGQKPKNIPAKPFRYFEHVVKVPFDIYDWLGMNQRTYLSFDDARSYVQGLKLKNYDEFRKWSDSDQRPSNIPANPSYVYREKGWYSYEDWTGIPH